MHDPVMLMGLELKNPLMVAAGPWARDAQSIQACIDAGAGAVTTETITLEANANIYPRLYYRDGQLFNTKLYSNLHLEEWEEQVEKIDKKGALLVFSVWGSSQSELSYLAKKVEKLGADAIEISISAPIGTRSTVLHTHSPATHEYVRAVVEAVEIPVMVKLSYEAAISPEFTRAIHEAGITAVSAIDALKGLIGVDVQRRTARMPTYGGYTGPHIRAVSLATTATLRQCTPFEICSVGGITSAEHVLEFLMLGAQAVQIASAIQLEGYEVIGRILADLERRVAAEGLPGLSAIRGSALASLRPFEEINPAPMKAFVRGTCSDADGTLRRGCIYRAITTGADGMVRIDPSRCTGCGLCAARCADGSIEMRWV